MTRMGKGLRLPDMFVQFCFENFADLMSGDDGFCCPGSPPPRPYKSEGPESLSGAADELG